MYSIVRRETDLSPEVHGKVEQEEEEVGHAETGKEETGVVAGRTLPPADDRQGESYGGVPDDSNLGGQFFIHIPARSLGN